MWVSMGEWEAMVRKAATLAKAREAQTDTPHCTCGQPLPDGRLGPWTCPACGFGWVACERASWHGRIGGDGKLWVSRGSRLVEPAEGTAE